MGVRDWDIKKCLSCPDDDHSIRDQYAGSYFSLFFFRDLYRQKTGYFVLDGAFVFCGALAGFRNVYVFARKIYNMKSERDIAHGRKAGREEEGDHK